MDLRDKQVQKNHTFFQSLKHALAGIFNTAKSERNFAFDLISACVVLIAAYLFRLNLMEWLFLVLAIVLVLAGELFNTVIEEICDLLVGSKLNVKVKVIKDTAAGLALLNAMFALVVGLLIFVPKIWALFV